MALYFDNKGKHYMMTAQLNNNGVNYIIEEQAQGMPEEKNKKMFEKTLRLFNKALKNKNAVNEIEFQDCFSTDENFRKIKPGMLKLIKKGKDTFNNVKVAVYEVKGAGVECYYVVYGAYENSGYVNVSIERNREYAEMCVEVEMKKVESEIERLAVESLLELQAINDREIRFMCFSN